MVTEETKKKVIDYLLTAACEYEDNAIDLILNGYLHHADMNMRAANSRLTSALFFEASPETEIIWLSYDYPEENWI